MEGKKISFGFLKTKKTVQPLQALVEEKKEYIECVEEQSIKVIGGEEIQEITPLVIPVKPNTLITAEKLKEIAEKVEKAIEDPPEQDNETVVIKVPENETLDQMAVRELLEDTKKDVKMETVVLSLPLPTKPVLVGQTESTLEDYEAVPVQDFGMAVLRGMGWTPGTDQSKYKQPQLRPKGLGLGADKVIKGNQKKNSSKDKEEELAIVKNSFIKITTGKYSGCYGKVVSLDEDNGRVMVDIPIKKETVSLSEFMMQPVTKSEYDKESKVINADSYEEYKKTERSQKSSTNDPPKSKDREASSSRHTTDLSRDHRERKELTREDIEKDNESEKKESSNGKSQRHKRDSSDSEERSRQRRKREKKKRRKSRSSSSSLSDHEKRRKHKSSRTRYNSSDSDDSHKKDRKQRNATPEGKRDIDKKRKGKKKKRDRDRSPNYKKHRK